MLVKPIRDFPVMALPRPRSAVLLEGRQGHQRQRHFFDLVRVDCPVTHGASCSYSAAQVKPHLASASAASCLVTLRSAAGGRDGPDCYPTVSCSASVCGFARSAPPSG